ncbi:myosin heavy chain, striated muscle-like [Daphnia pulex]|uniref:myosin heavy chain, striated muscle-like n=1 Tax=Daphnia pulex TaxID=6669 RepID=UPI001EDEEC15|nr:myosin heavy chain, striated muscle-like [Daphnia pulex]
MNDMLVVTLGVTLVVTLVVFLFVLTWIMNLLIRSTEKQTRLSAVNLNNIESDVNYATKPVIDQNFSTASGVLNNQSFHRLMADEKNLIVLENQRLAKELSLVQSQLTDSHSKVKQFRIESSVTSKSKLEKQKNLITNMTVKNLRLTDANSRLRRKVEDRDRIISHLTSSEIEKNLVLDRERLVNELSLELEEKKRLMTDIDMTEKMKNLRLTNDDSRLRRKIEDRDKIIASSRAIEKNLVLDKERLANELSLVQSQLTDSHSKVRQFHIELATTKSELEKQKNVSTDMTVKNIRLTNDDSRLRRKIEARDKIILAGRRELEELKEKADDDLATATIELESRNRTISELETEKIRLVENDSQLRRQLEEADLLLQSSQSEMEELRVSLNHQTYTIEHLQDQVKSLNEKKKRKKPLGNWQKWKIR